MCNYTIIPAKWNCNLGCLEQERFVIPCLTNRTHITGVNYKDISWNINWKTFINLYYKELENKEFHTYTQDSIQHIICWFDRNIIQRIPYDDKITLDVRIRIICGMVNKLTVIPRELKISLMECIWDTYKKFYQAYSNYYCHYILELPF